MPAQKLYTYFRQIAGSLSEDELKAALFTLQEREHITLQCGLEIEFQLNTNKHLNLSDKTTNRLLAYEKQRILDTLQTTEANPKTLMRKRQELATFSLKDVCLYQIYNHQELSSNLGRVIN
jgi:hypothetical protein